MNMLTKCLLLYVMRLLVYMPTLSTVRLVPYTT